MFHKVCKIYYVIFVINNTSCLLHLNITLFQFSNQFNDWNGNRRCRRRPESHFARLRNNTAHLLEYRSSRQRWRQRGYSACNFTRRCQWQSAGFQAIFIQGSPSREFSPVWMSSVSVGQLLQKLLLYYTIFEWNYYNLINMILCIIVQLEK